jgi:hypothetical protein
MRSIHAQAGQSQSLFADNHDLQHSNHLTAKLGVAEPGGRALKSDIS